ncbi:MAG: hypothetical protein KatS3mg077_0325 [Candidatus Binatia bacterium]|nr:MAG: hypothetical protein KatS3mg077_0325 [Candidatus Binatia bacterium]
MEHSLLHGLQLLGLVVAGGGLWLKLLFHFARLGSEAEGPDRLARLWGQRASWIAAAATFADSFVQVAEIENRTVFGGVPLNQWFAFVTTTTVGQIGLGRSIALFLLGSAFSAGGRLGWAIAAALYAVAAILAAAVSHAAAQPSESLTAVGWHLLHLLAISAWIGVVFHLWLQRPFWSAVHSATVAQGWVTLLRSFSPLALATAALVFSSGLVAALRFAPTLWDLGWSAYGLTLTLKLVLIVPIVLAGGYNFWIAVPALHTASQNFSPDTWRSVAVRFLRSLETEATMGLMVIAVAGIVGSVSPPGSDGTVTLSREQVAALLSPKLPATTFVDPTLFVGDAERNRFDLLYSEFMHNWSGVAVILMGAFWLLQGGQGTLALLAAKLWPLLFVPFAVFVSAFADPEVFVLRQVTFVEAVSDPVVLEHQIGALLIVLLAWLGWGDSRRPVVQRPLGPWLPVLMLVGSLLLLGHAHASVRATQELTNLINVQHAIFGSLGLLAGIVRWFMLRGLLPARVARVVWPSFIILLGVFMAFFYREAI